MMSASALIAAVYRRRALWDPSDVHHHNRIIITSLWHEVGKELGVHMMSAKSKWRGLRDYYRQQLRRYADQPVEMQYSSWAHFGEMSFLEGTMVPRSGRLVKEEPPLSPIPPTETMEQKWDESEEAAWSPNSHQYNNSTQLVRYAESLSSDPEDDDLHFFKSLLPDVRSLARPKKLLIRLKIQQLIYDEVYRGSTDVRDNTTNSPIVDN